MLHTFSCPLLLVVNSRIQASENFLAEPSRAQINEALVTSQTRNFYDDFMSTGAVAMVVK